MTKIIFWWSISDFSSILIYFSKETHYDRNHWWFIFDFFDFFVLLWSEMHYDKASNRSNSDSFSTFLIFDFQFISIRKRITIETIIWWFISNFFYFVSFYFDKETHYDRNHWWFIFSVYFDLFFKRNALRRTTNWNVMTNDFEIKESD